jgi:miniconductance mechanosensitive channel
MPKDVILTPDGLEKLKLELVDLQTNRRREVAERIKEARAFGDISENSEYDDAKNEQAMLEQRIASVEEKLRSATVIDAKDLTTDIVQVGSVVKVADQESGPVRSFAQVLRIILAIFTGIAVLSLVLGRNPFVLLTGLGAMTAVLMLIFKDAILGLVAGVQLSANRMVSLGDWIEMPKYGADGDVIDVALTTVKVQNWDKTITTIPTYALISESFKNWRGMSESGGRRIKRAVQIDIASIRFCDDDMLARYARIQHVSKYLADKQDELTRWNADHGVDASSAANGRRLTNVGTFRAYVVAYLRHHPLIHQDMTFLVRQLAPTAEGLPIEIYVFSRDQRWSYYEDLQADIFDHVLAVAREFDLRVFQRPAGSDFRQLGPAPAH